MTGTDGSPGTAVIFGAGPGLGAALARCFAAGGMRVSIVARNRNRLDALCDELTRGGVEVEAHTCDVTREGDVAAVFDRLDAAADPLRLVVFNAGAFVPAAVLEIETAQFEDCWRTGCLGGFLVGRESARRMSASGDGTIIFTGATASLRGGAGFANLAVGKFGLRALAQCMARELGPKGVHVAHVIIDGQIGSARTGGPADAGAQSATLDPDAIAANYLQLHRQPRSAWTLELDLRPWVEKF